VQPTWANFIFRDARALLACGRFPFGDENMRVYRSDAEIDEIVRKFEACEFELHEFDHAAHLTVAVAYVSRHGEAGAMDRMRESLLRFSAHHHRMGYHETITRFWLRVVANEFREGQSIYDQANRVVSTYRDKEFVFRFYTKERLASDQAKRQWLEPDLSDL
jgi:Ni/Co efflux regulator RcnB